MIDATTITFSPRLLKKTFSNKQMMKKRWEAEPTQPLPPQRRRVSFSAKDTVHSIPERSEISTDEKRDAWYDRYELYNIKRDNWRIIAELSTRFCSVNILENEARGLEHNTKANWNERELRIATCLLAVLEEQDVQQKIYGIVMDQKKIAKQYARTCQQCRFEAIKRGASDAKLVRGEFPINETKVPSSTSSSKRKNARIA